MWRCISCQKWWFSIAMLVYQRVPQILLSRIACLDFLGLLFSHTGSDIPKIGPNKNRSIITLYTTENEPFSTEKLKNHPSWCISYLKMVIFSNVMFFFFWGRGKVNYPLWYIYLFSLFFMRMESKVHIFQSAILVYLRVLTWMSQEVRINGWKVAKSPNRKGSFFCHHPWEHMFSQMGWVAWMSCRVVS